jgi:predicted RNA-binding protein YlqC (UPF0109 family)
MSGVDEAVTEQDGEVLPSDNVADLVEYLVASIVDNPDALVIDVTDGEASTLVEVHVDPADVGKVIGRHGRVIKSIRTLARACAARDNISADVEVVG